MICQNLEGQSFLLPKLTLWFLRSCNHEMPENRRLDHLDPRPQRPLAVTIFSTDSLQYFLTTYQSVFSTWFTVSQAVRGLVVVAGLSWYTEVCSALQSAAVLFTCECSFWDPPEEGGRALNFVVLEIHRLTLFYWGSSRTCSGDYLQNLLLNHLENTFLFLFRVN